MMAHKFATGKEVDACEYKRERKEKKLTDWGMQANAV